jgi:hypothetical protein
MNKKSQPSTEMLKDLKALFHKHDWPGSAIGLTASEANSSETNCVPPKKPTLVTIVHEDGTKESKTVCL